MRKLFVLSLVISFLISCRNENETIVSKDSYYPLAIGNYWIYQSVEIDSAGNETIRPKIDSVTISHDTTINNKQYFILEGTNNPMTPNWGIIAIFRDSSGYLVNNQGEILFTENNFTDTLYYKVERNNQDTLYSITYKMEASTNPVTVPAGIFNVLNFKGTVFTPREIPGVDNPRYLNTYYAKKVGKILQSYFYLSSPIIIEKRLIRYKTQE
ncbi:MAG: hypothetical protein HOO86_08450 [Bacteroidales bacterium]|nr:hypothetical protein [Bacteroidales bacterium]